MSVLSLGAVGVGGALLAAAVEEVGQGIVLTGAAVAALIYLIKAVRTLIRKADEILTELPASHDELARGHRELAEQVAADREHHEAAHAEMLTMVSQVSRQVEDVRDRLDVIEQGTHAGAEHVRAITREMDVPARQTPPADAA